MRDFYAYHASLMEPWDGPAVVAFTDGHVIGATLDRNGLRPGRWIETRDGCVVLASETGVFDVPPEQIERRAGCSPGKLFLVDLEAERIVPDDEIKQRPRRSAPYGEWLSRPRGAHRGPAREAPRVPRVEPLRARQLAFG